MNITVCGQVYEFKSINQEDGLPSSGINVLYQDSRNFIWIGTDGGGVLKYDGQNFNQIDFQNNIPIESISDIIEDENKNIIIATKYFGIYVFDGSKIIHKYNNKVDKNIKSDFVYKLIRKNDKIIAITLNDVIEIDKNYKSKSIYKAQIFKSVKIKKRVKITS